MDEEDKKAGRSKHRAGMDKPSLHFLKERLNRFDGHGWASGRPRVLRWRDQSIEAEFLWCRGRCPPVPMHHHPTWQLGAVRAGRLDFHVGSARVRLRAQDFMVVAPGVSHRPEAVEPHPADYLQVELPGESLGRAEVDHDPTRLIAHNPRAVVLMERLASVSWVGAPVGVRQTLARRLVRTLRGHFRQPACSRSPRLRLSDPVVDRLIAHLRSHPGRRVTVADMAVWSRLPRATLLRRFQLHSGTTPSRYHRYERLQAALQEIEQGYEIADVSLRFGFSDQAHLTRVARPLLGMGPAQWRRRLRR